MKRSKIRKKKNCAILVDVVLSTKLQSQRNRKSIMPSHDHTFVSNWPQKCCSSFLLARYRFVFSSRICQLVLLVRRICEAISIHTDLTVTNKNNAKKRPEQKKNPAHTERIEKNSASVRCQPPKWFQRKCSHCKWIEWIHISHIAAKRRTSLNLRKKNEMEKKNYTKKYIARCARVLSSGHLHRFMAHKSHRLECARRAYMWMGQRMKMKKKKKIKKGKAEYLSIRSAARDRSGARCSNTLQFHFRTMRWRFRFSIFATFIFQLRRRNTSTSSTPLPQSLTSFIRSVFFLIFR